MALDRTALLDSLRAAARADELTGLLGRYGGDEFVALLPGCTLADGIRLAERLTAATPAGRACSCGGAAWDGEEPQAGLVSRADSALLEAKQASRNRVAAAG